MTGTGKERQRGFTLLELMISMALLALIIVITLGALRLGSRSMAAGERKMEINERFRTAIAVMDAQIQSQMPLTHEEDGNKAYYFQGDGTTLQMATSHSLWGGKNGAVIVAYRVETDNAGRQTLYAVEHTPGMEEKREARLFTGASEISFEYFSPDPASEDGKQSERWTDETAIPEEIRLHLRYDAQDLLFRFPVRARGDMASTLMTPYSPTAAPKQRGTP